MNTTQNNGFYDLVKKCRGGLILNLPAFDSSAINRRIELKYNVDRIRIPRIYALGVFVDGTLEKLYKQGVFRIEPEKQFEKEVEEVFSPVENKTPVISETEIKDALLKGNRAKIKTWITNNVAAKDNIIIIARENIDSLSTSMVRDLENILNVELMVENE